MFSSLVAGCLAATLTLVLALGLVLASSADTRLNGASTTSKATAKVRSRFVACRMEYLPSPGNEIPLRALRVFRPLIPAKGGDFAPSNPSPACRASSPNNRVSRGFCQNAVISDWRKFS